MLGSTPTSTSESGNIASRLAFYKTKFYLVVSFYFLFLFFMINYVMWLKNNNHKSVVLMCLSWHSKRVLWKFSPTRRSKWGTLASLAVILIIIYLSQRVNFPSGFFTFSTTRLKTLLTESFFETGLSCNFEDGLCGWYQDASDNFDWFLLSGMDHTIGTGKPNKKCDSIVSCCLQQEPREHGK